VIRNRLALVAGIAAVGLTLVGGSALAATGSHVVLPSKITVKAQEFLFTTSADTVKAGKVTFVVTNKGNTVHNFVFPTMGNKGSRFLQSGQTQTFSLVLKAGRYPYICSIPRHAEQGMQGVLVVK